MNWADYVILGVLVVSTLIGLWRGFVSEVLSLVIWIGGFWVAWMYGPQVAAYFDHSIRTPELRLLAGYGVCLVGVLVVGALVKAIVNRLLIGTGLSGLDRAIGLVFGLGRGILLVALMVFLLGLTAVTREPWWRESALLPQFQGVAVALGKELPPSTGRYLHPSPEVLDKLHDMPEAAQLPDLRAVPDMGRLLDGTGHPPASATRDPASPLHAVPPAPTSAPVPAASAEAAGSPTP